MKFVFRVDASIVLGTGHVMRCIALADALRRQGGDIRFICRQSPGHLIPLLQERGYSVDILQPEPSHEFSWEQDAHESGVVLRAFNPDWLIVDHYQLDARWETFHRYASRRIMVIDDMADRRHDCDLLLDQNLGEGYLQRYRSLVPSPCIIQLGPEQALLREEFRPYQTRRRTRDGRVRRILIFMGGADANNVTEKAIHAALTAAPYAAIDVIAGYSNPFHEALRALCARHASCTYRTGTNQISLLMEESDLALGGGGQTIWERCILGLPSIAVILADNQMRSITSAAKSGALINAGIYSDLKTPQLASCIEALSRDREGLVAMGHRARALLGQQTQWAVDVLSDRLLRWESYAPA